MQKPTVDQVAEYCAERKNNVDPEAFVSFYESKGWKIGKNAMKDWRAAVHTWERGSGRNNAAKARTVPERIEQATEQQRRAEGSDGTAAGNVLTAEHMRRLWLRLGKIYGHRWASSYGDSDDGTWLVGLSGITPAMVKHGLSVCVLREDAWPPSLPEFRWMCQGVDDALVKSIQKRFLPSTFDRHRMSHDELRRAEKDAREKAIQYITENLKKSPQMFFDIRKNQELLTND